MNKKSINSDKKKCVYLVKVILFLCIAAKLLICLWPLYYGDGYSGKELYIIALSNYLALGYVNIPPLTPLLLAGISSLLGRSLFALHLLPAITGALIVYFTYLIVKEFGGNSYAQSVAPICVTLAPCNLLLESMYTPWYLNNLIWIIILYLIILLLKTDNRKYWIYIGIFFGIGLLTKWSVIFLGLGVVGAFLVTTHKNFSTYTKYFYCRQFWSCLLIALLIFSPFLIWNIYYGYPASEYILNVFALRKANGAGIITTVLQMIFFMNPLTLPIWLFGICYFIFDIDGKKYRLLSTAFILILILCLFKKTVFYVPVAFFPILFAGGALGIEKLPWLNKKYWIKVSYVLLVILTAVWMLPLVKPVLPVSKFKKYYMPYIPSGLLELEKQKPATLPQWYADRFGWKDLTEQVAKIYQSLPYVEKSKVAIFAKNCEEASAISFFGKKYRLPEPISSNNQYYLWGLRGYNSGPMIVIENAKLEHYKKIFKYVRLAGHVSNKDSMSLMNNMPIWLCKEPYISIKKSWCSIKHYD